MNALNGLMPDGMTSDGFGAALREALVAARDIGVNARWSLTAATKMTGRPGEVVTSADLAGQDVALELLHLRFPLLGKLAEEGGVAIPCRLPPELGDYRWTVDVFDGSRRLSNAGLLAGVGAMISLIKVEPDGRYDVLAAGVIALQGGEIYAFDPWSDGLYCFTEADSQPRRLPGPLLTKGLRGARWLIRGNPRSLYGSAGRCLDDASNGGLVGRLSGAAGCLPLAAADLYFGDATAMVIMPREAITAVWDHAPMAGLLRAAGLVPVAVTDTGHVATDAEPQLLSGQHRPNATFWVPSVLVGELTNYVAGLRF